jgi:transcriptional regulator with XRE-family HTH domain
MISSRKDIVERLKALPDAFEISDAELCRRIKIGTTAWANYVSMKTKNKLPVHVADRLCEEFNITLDWIYRGKTALIPQEVLAKLRRQAAA